MIATTPSFLDFLIHLTGRLVWMVDDLSVIFAHLAKGASGKLFKTIASGHLAKSCPEVEECDDVDPDYACTGGHQIAVLFAGVVICQISNVGFTDPNCLPCSGTDRGVPTSSSLNGTHILTYDQKVGSECYFEKLSISNITWDVYNFATFPPGYCYDGDSPDSSDTSNYDIKVRILEPNLPNQHRLAEVDVRNGGSETCAPGDLLYEDLKGGGSQTVCVQSTNDIWKCERFTFGEHIGSVGTMDVTNLSV